MTVKNYTEEIGEIYNVTRERVRQIEKEQKNFRTSIEELVSNFWQNTLDNIVENSDRPISINNLDKNHQVTEK